MPLEPLSALRESPLFAGVKPDELKQLAASCEVLPSFAVGDVVHAPGRKSLPILLITKGCIAVQISSRYNQHADIIAALIMPRQMVGEFEFLNIRPQLKLFAVAPTEVLKISPDRFGEFVKSHPPVMANLAASLVEKSEINNFHLEVVSQSTGQKKLATTLTGFSILPMWKLNDYKDETLRSPMTLPICWSIALLRKYLVCDKRTVREGLMRLVEYKLIEIEWLDVDMKPVTNISAMDLMRFGTRDQDKVQEKTYFHITILNPQKLDDYCVDSLA